MSTPSPLQNQDPLQGSSAPKSRMRVTVLTILALHVVFIGGLLLQGCDKKSGGAAQTPGNASNLGGLPPLGDPTNTTLSTFPGDAAAAGGTTTGAGTGTGAGMPSLGSPNPGAGAGGGGGLAAADPGAAPTGAAPVNPPTGGLGTLPPGASTQLDAASAAASSGTEHVIKAGDKIGDLAKKYGVTAQAIIDANPNAKPRNLKVGDKLNIPAPAPAAAAASTAASAPAQGGAAAAAPAVDSQTYVVKQGDNLSKIAKKFGVSPKALRAANNLKGDRIVPKQKLVIPAKQAGTEPAAAGGTGHGI